MVISSLILVISAGLLVYYIQSLCEKVLRREFERPYYQLIVDTNQLAFPSLRKALEKNEREVDFQRLWLGLKCDFMTIKFLVKNVGGRRFRVTPGEWLLLFYSTFLFLSLQLRNGVGAGVRPSALKLTSILKYFANVVGERITKVGVGDLEHST